ncbi:glycosyl hydrolase family 18 protein [Mucilaginibacter sp.]
MKRYTQYSILIILFILSFAASQTVWGKPIAKTPIPGIPFKVIGYLRTNDITSDRVARFDLNKITHLNIAFINPDSNGNFSMINGLTALVIRAHAKHVKVLASIGGGLAPEYYSSLIADDISRRKLVDGLMALCEQYQLDGVDVDLEGHFIDINYEPFVTELKAALKPKLKLLTTAVATVYGTQYTDKALAQFDFINIMSYDKTGPWKPEQPGQHAPYEMAVEDLDYWGSTRGISKERMNLGLPFYAYGFGSGVPSDMSYSDIIKSYPGSEKNDEMTVAAGGTIYYNGSPTIKAKTNLALQKAGGVMIWQLLQDDTGSKSLLNMINKEIKAVKK